MLKEKRMRENVNKKEKKTKWKKKMMEICRKEKGNTVPAGLSTIIAIEITADIVCSYQLNNKISDSMIMIMMMMFTLTHYVCLCACLPLESFIVFSVTMSRIAV